MRIDDRVEQIRKGEHERLRQAIARIDSALRAMVEEEELANREVVRFDIFGERQKETPPPPPRRKSVVPLRLAWSPLEEAILARLDRWEGYLLPVCRRWMAGEPLEEELREHAIALMDGRTRIEGLLREFRNQALFFESTRDLVRSLVTALEASDRAEEDEVLPALLAGIPEVSATSTPRSASSEEVARNLRAKATASRPPESKEPPKRGLSRWLPWGR